jgi:hypothetical protein
MPAALGRQQGDADAEPVGAALATASLLPV